MDLAGNQYYYFKPTSAPPRRILQNNPKIPYSDIQITPAWHQWLRHTRPEPPSLQEQQQDVMRQQELKQLAAAADARWAAKPSVMDRPRRANQELGIGDGEGATGNVGVKQELGRVLKKGETGDVVKQKDMEIGDPITEGPALKRERKEQTKENPWKKQERGAAGETYQPEAWSPGSARKE